MLEKEFKCTQCSVRKQCAVKLQFVLEDDKFQTLAYADNAVPIKFN